MKFLNQFTVLVHFTFTNIIYAVTENVLEDLHTFDYNTNVTSRQAGQIRFEEDSQFSSQYLDNSHHITFEGQAGQAVKFEDSTQPAKNPGRVTFQDDNRIKDGIKKKRKRRRKPRLQRPYPNVQGNLPLGQPPYPYPGFPGPQYPGVNPVGASPNGPYYRPPRRPKPSFASEALSTITGALTSIALYDDYQCVPRLLCEAAGGGPLGSSSILQSVAGLQPLLTLLSAYGGVSSSPLFVFGRAVFLGMTAKGNTASCRYAYSQCPTDPEQLVHYLNNHNGGFFRFFNAPQSQNPQNLQQFYNQLSIPGQYPNTQIQNYGSYDSNTDSQNYGLYPQQNQYGLQNPSNGLQNPVPHNGFYNPEYFNYQQSLYNQQYSSNNGQNPYLNSNGYGYLQNYGQKYPYQDKYGFKKLKFKEKSSSNNRIEKRIQNRPNPIEDSVENIDSNVKWTFPDDFNKHSEESTENVRDSKSLRFPEENNETYFENSNKIRIPGNTRKPKAAFFPEIQNNKNRNLYNYVPISDKDIYRNEYYNIKYDSNEESNQNKLTSFFNNFKQYINNNNFNHYISDDEENGIRTVYIVRGNGDPNKPEIVKIRPGEAVQ